VPTVQGRNASQEEARVAIALDSLKHRYQFQYRVFSITGVKGSFVLDFLVTSTVPFPTPLEVFGEYFHSASITRKDQLRLQRIEFELGPNINETAIIWGSEASTQAATNEAVLRKVGRS